MEVKIIRLVSGEDIIGRVEYFDDGFISIFDPMVFMLRETGKSTNLLMQHWLPVNLLEKNEARISPVNVVTMCNPTNQFSEYYTNTVDKVNSVVGSIDDDLDEDEVDQIMEAMEEIRKDNRLLH